MGTAPKKGDAGTQILQRQAKSAFMGRKFTHLIQLFIEITTMRTLGTPDALPNERH